jgi:hypothetical protein
MGVRTYESAPEPRRRLPGPGLPSTLAVAGLTSLLLLANGRPLGEPDLSGLAGALAQAVFWVVGLVLELDPVGHAVVGKVLAALVAGVAAGALFAAAARHRTLSDARACGLVLAVGTTLAAASQSWSAEVPAAAAVSVALYFLARAEAEDDPTPAAQGAVPLAIAVVLAPSTWLLAVVLLFTSLLRWHRTVLKVLPWTVASVTLALVGVALGSGPEPSSASSGGGVALLVSPARGALFFAPVALVCLAGIVRVLRPPRGRHHWDQGAPVSWLPLAAAGAAVAHLIWVAIDGSPTGAPFWGPRGLAPAWPPLVLLLPEGLALLRAVGLVIAALSVAVQALGAFAYDGRWDRLHGDDPAVTWDLLRSPVVFQIRERAVRFAVPAVEDRRLIVREHPLVIGGPTGSLVSFSDGRVAVTGADATLGDALLEGGARAAGDRLRLRAPDDALFFRVRLAARPRRLELRIAGRGSGILGVGEKTFWTAPLWTEHRVGGTFRLRLPYSYADSGGGDIRLVSRSGEIEVASVALVPPGEPENVIRLR